MTVKEIGSPWKRGGPSFPLIANASCCELEDRCEAINNFPKARASNLRATPSAIGILSLSLLNTNPAVPCFYKLRGQTARALLGMKLLCYVMPQDTL
jgi:hypothetical protein